MTTRATDETWFGNVPEFMRQTARAVYCDLRSHVPESQQAVFHGIGMGKKLHHIEGENKWRKYRIDAGRATEELSESLAVDNKVIQRLENDVTGFAQCTITKLYKFYPSEWLDTLLVLQQDNKQ